MNGAVTPEEFDYFHEMIVTQELCRTGSRSFNDGNLGGMVIGLPAVLNHARNDAVRERVTEDCLSGKKKICLAISEAFAGSDVAGLKTTAVKSADGSHYIVNGTKKWITNGTFCDYFVTGVRTKKGFSMLLIERQEGVETQQIKTSYSTTAGTAYIKFDNVKVPVENLLGVEDDGFRVIMTNFNHERWMITTFSIRTSRMIVEDCLKWSNQRMVFGKRLIEQPVIRQKYVHTQSFSSPQHPLLTLRYTNPSPPDSPKSSPTPRRSNRT
jgi:alkylation response protein AidB-like acyl-CoA dehydrogenase